MQNRSLFISGKALVPHPLQNQSDKSKNQSDKSKNQSDKSKTRVVYHLLCAHPLWLICGHSVCAGRCMHSVPFCCAVELCSIILATWSVTHSKLISCFPIHLSHLTSYMWASGISVVCAGSLIVTFDLILWVKLELGKLVLATIKLQSNSTQHC